MFAKGGLAIYGATSFYKRRFRNTKVGSSILLRSTTRFRGQGAIAVLLLWACVRGPLPTRRAESDEAWQRLSSPSPIASAQTRRTPASPRNAWKMPIALLPPPTRK